MRALPWSRRISGGQASGQVQVARGSSTRHDQGKTPSCAKFLASKSVDLYSTGTRSASFKGQRGEDVNVKRAVATAAGVFGALLLAAVVGLGHFAGHSSGAGTQARAAVIHAAPVKANLTALIYGDSVDAPATSSAATPTTASSTSSSTPSYVDDSSSYTSTYGSDGSSTPASSDGTSTIYGDGSSDIYGDGSSDIYGDGGNIYGDSSPATANSIYGD
jgi:hypothetical protein